MSHHDQPGPPREPARHPDHPALPEPAAGFDALMAEVLAGSGGRFGHRQHVQLTWLAVRRFGMPTAIGLVSDGIRRTARYAGVPQKYHETISRAWVELVAHHAIGHPAPATGQPSHATTGQPAPTRHSNPARQPAPARDSAPVCHSAGMCVRTHIMSPGRAADAEADFAAFATRNPLLLDKRLLTRFYHSATLASPAARAGWVEPDRAPFPWAAVG